MTTRLERGLQILSLLESEGSYNAHQLASKMGVTRRTIFRDIALLRQLGWPVEFDAESSSYLLDPAEAKPGGSSGSTPARESPWPAEPRQVDAERKVGAEALPWDETVQAVARAVRRGEPLELRKIPPPPDREGSVVMRPAELIFSSSGWSVKGEDLTAPANESRMVAVTLAEYRWVGPAAGRQPQPPQRDTSTHDSAARESAEGEPAASEPAEREPARPPHAASASGSTAAGRRASAEGSG